MKNHVKKVVQVEESVKKEDAIVLKDGLVISVTSKHVQIIVMVMEIV